MSRCRCAGVVGTMRTVYSLARPWYAAVDPFHLLGVSRGASAEEIKRAYLKRAKELHPDRNKAPDAQQAFQQLQDAYSAISGGSESSQSSTQGGPQSHYSPGMGMQYESRGYGPAGGPGFHYDAFAQMRAREQAEREAAWRAAPLYSRWWAYYSNRRAWRRHGPVHRSVYMAPSAIGRLWPLWILIGFLLLRPPRFHDGQGQRFYVDHEGKAYVADARGNWYRARDLDSISESQR